MSEMIERVALAIKADMARQWSATVPGGASQADNWTATGGVLDLEQIAKAALVAMREPTLAMVQSAWAANGYRGDMTAREWSAMIDGELSNTNASVDV